MSAANGSAYGVGNCSFWMPIGGGFNQDVEPLVQNTTYLQGNIAATAASGNLLTVGGNLNGLKTGQIVIYTGSGVTGLTSGNAYYLYIATNTTFGLATTAANAIAGTLISISGTPSGGQLAFDPILGAVLTGNSTDMICCANVFADAGHVVALDGMGVQQVNDVSGNSGAAAATQTNPQLQPIFRAQGYFSDPDGCVAFLDFPVNDYPSSTQSCLALPSSCEIGGGAVANEGTIIWCGRMKPNGGYNGGSGPSPMNLFHIGNTSLSFSQSGQGVNAVYNGSAHNFQKTFVIPDMHPVTIALRFSSASGTIGVSQTKLYVGQNFTDTIAGGNVLSGTQSGGYIGYENVNYNVAQELAEFIVFDRALTDTQILTIMQTMQDRVCGGYTIPAQIFYFGDSRTQGQSPDVDPNGDAIRRNWPMRAGKRLGRTANWQINISQSGNSVTMQQAAWNNINGVVDTADFSNSVAIGEVGVNDVGYRNSSTATCTWSTTGNSVTINSQTYPQICAGQTVTGTGIPANTTVEFVTWNGASQVGFTLSNTPTVAGSSGTLTFTCNANSIQTALYNLWTSMLGAGVKQVIAMTIPLGASAGVNATMVNAVNTWMRTPGNLPAGVFLCDNAADTRLSGGAPAGYQATDELHWTDAGYGVYAQNAAFGTNPTLAPSAVGTGGLASALGIGGASPISFFGNFGTFSMRGQFAGNFGVFAA
ncbi:MAG: hypothetical protein ABSH22_15585 [Tepidisphaeraceae bacterium]